MDLSKISIKKIRELIVFTTFLVVALWKFDVVLGVLKAIWGIIFPFILGGAIAFLTNVPMSFLEKTIFKNVKKENKIAGKLARPTSLLLTIVLIVGVIALVMFGVIPQLTRTMGTLMMSISDFIPQMQSWIREFFHNNQEIMKLVDQIQFDPDRAIRWGISLLGNGAGNMMNTTMSAVGSIVSGLATFFIAFSFACYVLFQKEKLHLQIRKVRNPVFRCNFLCLSSFSGTWCTQHNNSHNKYPPFLYEAYRVSHPFGAARTGKTNATVTVTNKFRLYQIKAVTLTHHNLHF